MSTCRRYNSTKLYRFAVVSNILCVINEYCAVYIGTIVISMYILYYYCTNNVQNVQSFSYKGSCTKNSDNMYKETCTKNNSDNMYLHNILYILYIYT